MSQLPRGVAAALGLSVALVLGSCSQTGPGSPSGPSGSPSAPSASPSAPRPTSTPTTAPARQISISVTGKQVRPAPALVSIAIGEALTVKVTSDHDDTLHAHGFDIELPVKAGKRLEFTVTGSQPGVYDVELHDPELRLLRVAVR